MAGILPYRPEDLIAILMLQHALQKAGGLQAVQQNYGTGVPGVQTLPGNHPDTYIGSDGKPHPWPGSAPQTAPPPVPMRNPRRQALENELNASFPDALVLENEIRQGHTSPMYGPEEFNPGGRQRRPRAT